jgi:hypothetical protein
VLLGPADRLEPGARWVNSSTDQYAPALKVEFVSRSIRLQARPNTEPQFCGLEIVNAVLTVGGVAFERRTHTDSHYARTPARARHGPSGGVGSCSKRSRTAFASQSRCWEYWSVNELTHRAPGSRRAAGSRKHSSGMRRVCWRTIFICEKPQRYDKPLKQLGLLSRQADIRRVTGAAASTCGKLRRRGCPDHHDQTLWSRAN